MMLRIKNGSLSIAIILFVFSNSYTMNVQDYDSAFCSGSADCGTNTTTTDTSTTNNTNTNYTGFNDINSYNFTAETDTEKFRSSTTTHEDHIILTQSYCNYETGEVRQGEYKLDRDYFNTNDISPFDCNLQSAHSESQAPSNNINGTDQSNIRSNEHDHFNDHFKESAAEQQRQIAEYNRVIQENNTKNNDDYVILKNDLNKQPTTGNLILASSSIATNLRVQQLKYEITDKEARKSKTWFRKKHISNAANEIKFCDTFISGKVTQLLKQKELPDLFVAQTAFNELKELWPFKRDYTFLIPNLVNGTGETDFIARLGINNIMEIAERDLLTRQDYIDKYANAQAVQEYKEYSLMLQKKGNCSSLFKEKDLLYHCVIKNGRNTDITTNICLAIAEKALFHPMTPIFYGIVHAPSLEDARNRLEHLELQILDQAQQKNIALTSEIKKMLIKEYGFDVLDEAHDCYISRPDYIHATKNQSLFFNPLDTTLHNIEHKNLYIAHAELVHLQKQVLEGLESLNITDPIAQKERIIKDFGQDIIELANNTYKERIDHKNLINSFIPIDVHNTSIEILNDNYTYASVSNQLDIMAQHVFRNARLCGMNFIPEIEAHVIDALQIIQAPPNDAEFVLNVTVVDHLLTDIQSQVDSIVKGKSTAWVRSSELFTRAVVNFITALNPITQAKSICELLKDAGHLTSYVLRHPIYSLHAVREINTKACELLINSGCFITDLTIGKIYLAPQEYQQRCDLFWNTTSSIVTPENVIDLVAQVLADFAFSKGFVSAFVYLKEIDAASKLQEQIAKVANKLKTAVDTHLANNPILVTAEGVALQISNNLKNIGGTIVEIITESRMFIESMISGPLHRAMLEIEELKRIFDCKRKGFAEFSTQWIKIPYAHIFGMELKWAKEGNLIKFSGFHHDFMKAIEESGAIKFINKVINEHGCYSASLIVDGLQVPKKTFFPSQWSREKVVSKIYEAYDHFIKSKAIPFEKNGKYVIEGLTQEGINVRMFITKNGQIATAYPIL